MPVRAVNPDIVLFNDAEACDLNGPYVMCRRVGQDVCCYDSRVLYSCAYLDSDDERRILHAYSSQPERNNYCAINLMQALANICICPTGYEVISGAKWNYNRNGRDGKDVARAEEKPCEPVAVDAIGARINGTKYVISNATDPAGFAQVNALRGKVDPATIKDLILTLGTAEE